MKRFIAQKRWSPVRIWPTGPRDRRGAAAIEFAFVAVPFLLLILGTVELGLIFVTNTSLSSATLGLARQIRVGQIMASGVASTSSTGKQLDTSDFKAAICARMLTVPASTCMNQLQVDVRTQSTFGGQSSPSPLAASNFKTSSLCFYSGSPGSIVSLRVYYLWTVLSPMLYPLIANTTSVTTSAGTTTGHFFVLTSTEVFKNEPNATLSNNGAGC